MQKEFIKLKVKKEASRGRKANVIKEVFIESCLSLDASIFEPLIMEGQYFQELGKYRFLASLQKEFNIWIAKGFNKTYLMEGKCIGCYFGNKSFQFYTNKVTPAFAYIIHEEHNGIEDIFMCNSTDGMQTVDLGKLRNFDFWRTKRC